MVTGSSSGQVTYQKRFHGRAPSIAAASFSSGLMVCRPASRLMAKNGTPRQMLTTMIEVMARSGSPSQLMRWVMMPSWNSDQLMTLKVGSNIHFQAKVDSTVGMMKGSRMKARTIALPLKWRLSSIASHRPSASLNTVVTPVYQNVFQTVVRKMLSFQTLTKLSSPTQWPGTPTRWLVSDNRTPSMKG